MQEIFDTAQRFLDALGDQHTFQTFHDFDKKQPAKQYHGSFHDIAPRLLQDNANGYGIFVTVQGTDLRGRKKANITTARALFVDSDTRANVLAPLAPSIRIQSSPGKEHLYWLLQPGEDLTRIPEAQALLARELDTDPQVRDLPRVMRVPGFAHWKSKTAQLCHLISCDADLRYTIDDVLGAFSDEKSNAYATWVLMRAIERLRLAEEGGRNNALNTAAFIIKDYINDGRLARDPAREILLQAALQTGLPEDECIYTIDRCLSETTTSKAYVSPEASPTPPDTPEGMLPVGGREADISAHLLGELAPALDHLRSVSGALWQYDDGVWAERTDDVLKAHIQRYHGRFYYTTDGTMKQYAISPTKRDAILDMAKHDHRVLDRRFFDDAPVGIKLTDAFITLDGKNVTVADPSPDWRCRTSLDTPYQPDQRAPFWETFLSEVFSGDEEMIRILQEGVGAALFGIAPQYAKAFILVGNGANGKSVLLSALSTLLFPQSAVSFVPPGRWGQEYYVYEMRHALVNVVSELPAWNIISTDAFKAVVAGDPVLGRAPYGQAIHFRPRALHLFACNELPATKDFTHGFWRRFTVLPFKRTFDGTTTAGDILASLQTERSGMVSWAIQGAQRLIEQRGYTGSANVAQAAAEWRLESDPVASFVSACCTDGTCRATDMYRYFSQWCNAAGRMVLSGVRFGKRLQQLGVEKKRDRSGNIYLKKVLPVEQWEL